MTSYSYYLVVLALVGAERLFELRLSRRNLRRALAGGGREHGIRHFRVMAAIHTLFLLSCAAEVFAFDRSFDPRIALPAGAAVIAAQALRYWVILTLGERWNVRVVVVPGAAPVTSGPYKFLRHPNYVAVIVEIIALPLIHNAWLTALVFSGLNALVLAVRIQVEERALGADYARTFAGTPRFFPRGNIHD